MRIVFVDTTNDESLIGGGHLILPVLMAGMKQRGHEVHLVTKGIPHPRINRQIEESGAVVHIKPWKRNGLVRDTAPVFANWINSLQPDCYIISGSADIGWVALPLLGSGIATFTIGHNDTDNFYLPVKHYSQFLTKAIGVSKKICENYIDISGFPVPDITCIPYGVETSSTVDKDTAPDVLKIIYVGRVVEEQKKVSDLIAIAKELYKTNVKFTLRIIGDGPQMSELKAALSKEINNDKVTLSGWLEKDEVIKALRRSDIFILTSAYEGFSIALTEAMANGCCPVVTDIPSGSQQLINNGSNGFLIGLGNVDEFTNQLTQLSGNRQELDKVREAAWTTGKAYSIARMVESYEDCFIQAFTAIKNKPLRLPAADFPLMESCRSKYPNWARRLKLLIKGDS